MTGAEMAARITAATALLADYRRHSAVPLPGMELAVWCGRLERHLGYVLDELGRSAPPAPRVAQGGSYVADDGSAWLSPADVQTVREALFHATDSASGADAVRYDSLRFRLGDDR